uniref:Uncharacterized protein n=1 Tax=Siphoviridae sp. ctpoI7 TaxID=2825678 RepID=A0A8S5PB17_9CAUD|nr:MAG TPA: hypothetical protein [Siphoviridae sp. ctpoI7]
MRLLYSPPRFLIIFHKASKNAKSRIMSYLMKI